MYVLGASEVQPQPEHEANWFHEVSEETRLETWS